MSAFFWKKRDVVWFYDLMHVSTYAWWSSFKPIAFVLELKVYMSVPMLRPHCEDVPNKGLIKYQLSALMLLQFSQTFSLKSARIRP